MLKTLLARITVKLSWDVIMMQRLLSELNERQIFLACIKWERRVEDRNSPVLRM